MLRVEEMKTRKVLIRYKWCKTAILFYLIFFMFSVLTVIDSRFAPLMVFFAIDFLLTVSAAFYLVIEDYEKESV